MLTRLQNVGIIPDGNRRWANANGYDLTVVYRNSLKRIFEIAEISPQSNVEHICFYGLSADNLSKRPSSITNAVIDIFCEYAEDFIFRNKNIFKLNIVGDEIDNKNINILKYSTAQPKSFKNQITFLINYSAFWDLSTYPEFRSKSIPDMDLIIRTGAHKRLSEFLPIQSRYADLIFSDKNFPDYSQNDFRRDVNSLKSIPKHFGA